MNPYWSTITPEAYQNMIARHAPLWSFVRRKIIEWKVKTILEVGGGLIQVARYGSDEYINVDLNPNAPGMHEDFLTAKLDAYRGADLILAANVIEHCPQGYRPFLDKIIALEPKRAIVSFFNGILRHKDYFLIDRAGVFRNRYSKWKMGRYLRSKGVRFRWEILARRDKVLLIEQGETS